MGGRCFVYIQSWHRCIFKKKNPPPLLELHLPPSFPPSPPVWLISPASARKQKRCFEWADKYLRNVLGSGRDEGGSDWGLYFFFCLLLLVCFWGVLAKGEVTDQCCKVYRLHVIVTAVTAIVLFLLFLCFLPRQWSVGTGMHKTLFLFMIFTRVLCIFAFATKKLNFCVIRKREFVWFFFFPQHAFSLQTRHYVLRRMRRSWIFISRQCLSCFRLVRVHSFSFQLAAWRVCVMVNRLPKVFYWWWLLLLAFILFFFIIITITIITVFIIVVNIIIIQGKDDTKLNKEISGW